jgi:signal transduction histidine kinase
MLMAAVIAAAVGAAVAGAAVSLWIAVADHHSVVGAAFNGAVVLAFAIVGAVVVGARPKSTVGWGMLVGGVVWSLGGAGADLATHGIVADPGSVPAVAAFAIGGSAARALGWYSITLAVPAAFPDGRVRDTPWLWRALVVIAVGSVLDPLTDKQADLYGLGAWRNPIAHHPWDFLSPLAFLAHVPLSIVATVGVVVLLVRRWRSGDPLRRQQLLLFAGAAVLPIVAVPLAFGFGAGGWVFGAAALPLPFAIGFAVLAKGLYDLRTAANRTLVWVTLSAVVAGIYALVIVAGASILHVAPSAPWLPWAAAAVAAVAFAPVRDGLQRGINRLTFGRWDEPYEVLAALGQRLEASVDVDRLLAEVTTELRGLGLRDVAVCDDEGATVAGVDGIATVAGRDAAADADADADADGDAVAVPLSAYGHPVGSLRYRPPPTPLRIRDRRLLDDLAGHLGGVLYARRLTRELQQALERLVVTREEERRRLRRDLHDGLGPALAGHLLRLDLVASKLGPADPAAADVQALRDELRGTVLEVRRVVEGLRPPSLDELGLAGALAQTTGRLVAGTGIDLELHVADLPTLPAAVEVATYRIVTEAVTNVVRHADATHCRIEVATDDTCLRLSVTDDGHGFESVNGSLAGHGLHTMRERAEELRGTLRVSSEGGASVVAELPIPSGVARTNGRDRS